MRLSADLLAFQGRLGHQFRKPDLLLRAVTHASIGSATRPDNQRLEFLGDRVLGLVMAEALLAADGAASDASTAAVVRSRRFMLGSGRDRPRCRSRGE